MRYARNGAVMARAAFGRLTIVCRAQLITVKAKPTASEQHKVWRSHARPALESSLAHSSISYMGWMPQMTEERSRAVCAVSLLSHVLQHTW